MWDETFQLSQEVIYWPLKQRFFFFKLTLEHDSFSQFQCFLTFAWITSQISFLSLSLSFPGNSSKRSVRSSDLISESLLKLAPATIKGWRCQDPQTGLTSASGVCTSGHVNLSLRLKTACAFTVPPQDYWQTFSMEGQKHIIQSFAVLHYHRVH